MNLSSGLVKLYFLILQSINWQTPKALIWKRCQWLLYIRVNWQVVNQARKLLWKIWVCLSWPGSLAKPPLRPYLSHEKFTRTFPPKVFMRKNKKTISSLVCMEKDFKIVMKKQEIKRKGKEMATTYILYRNGLQRGRSWSWRRIWTVLLLWNTPTQSLQGGLTRNHRKQRPTRTHQQPTKLHWGFIWLHNRENRK